MSSLSNAIECVKIFGEKNLSSLDNTIECIKTFGDKCKNQEVKDFCNNLVEGIELKETQFVCSILSFYLVNITMRDYDDITIERLIIDIIHKYRDLKERIEMENENEEGT